MKELDFDELDKAVNSLMSGVTKTKPVKPDDETKTLTIQPVLSDGIAPAFDKSGAISVSTSPDVQRPKESAKSTPSSSNTKDESSNHRGGRFMDVVHPSSDMTTTSPIKAPVSRQGLTIEPRSPHPLLEATTENEDVKVTVVPASPPKEPVSQPQPPSVASDALESEWPDPLDTIMEQENIAPSPPDLAPVVERDILAEDILKKEVQPTEDKPQAPLSSPFLSDAKVEKRPLGGGVPSYTSQEENVSPVSTSLSDKFEKVDNTEAQLPAEPDTSEPLPEEFNGELMAIESGNQATLSQEQETSATSASSAAMPVSNASLNTVGAGSITQQYHEEPNTGEQASGGIYDTAMYHQPLSHPAKKKSSWLLIAAIIGILALGATAGAALYFLNLF